MSTKIYVKHLTFTTTEQDLQETCQKFGTVTDVRIIKDRDTGRSRGFGFVTFSEENAANTAIHELTGFNLHGRDLKVEIAIDKNNSHGRSQINS